VSGFAGVVNLDGAFASRRSIDSMAQALALDGRPASTRLAGCAALACGSGVPLITLDDRVWVVGEARLDSRSDVIGALRSSPHAVTGAAADIELVLRAYLTWGDLCVERLSGDFAFALWDAVRGRLFAARDQLGVKPFYYARTGATLIFGNTLASMRRHSAVSGRLDAGAIADFLLFDVNRDVSTTAFADIRRLPPAHVLTATGPDTAVSRYWTMPIDEPIFFRRLDDYTDAFDSLLRTAVSQRVSGRTVGVFMSGGLDSTTLAAAAQSVARIREDGSAVRAFCWVEDRHDGGAERRYASIAAAHIGIPVDFYEPDIEPVDWNWEHRAETTPEPAAMGWRASIWNTYYRRISSIAPVVLLGEGPDNALYYEWQSFLRFLAATPRLGQMAVAAGRHLATQRRLPLWQHWFRRPDAPARTYPTWLARSFEARVAGRERWYESGLSRAPATHPVRPQAYASLFSPLWQQLFQRYAPERTGAGLEVRYPFVDTRLLRFMLAIPAIPWCRRKYLLRRAMRGRLPAPILRRDKTSVPGPGLAQIKARLIAQPFAAMPALHEYVDVERLTSRPASDPDAIDAELRVRVLNQWLRRQSIQAA
jgi:asparagine synthase (glutamine-hydrolysing)